MTDTKPSKRSSSAKTSGNVLSEEERAAIKETIRERKKAAKRSPEEQRVEGEADVQGKIAEMAENDRAIAARVHELVLAAAPDLVPRASYGMPAAVQGRAVPAIDPGSLPPYRSSSTAGESAHRTHADAVGNRS